MTRRVVCGGSGQVALRQCCGQRCPESRKRDPIIHATFFAATRLMMWLCKGASNLSGRPQLGHERSYLVDRPPTKCGTICGSGARSRGVARRGHGLGESRRADHRAAPSIWAGEPAAREAVASRQIDSSMCAGPTATGDPTSVERLGRARTRRLLVGRGSKLFGGLPVGQVCD